MEILRTPDERFENLLDFDFSPRYTEIAAGNETVLRAHHVDEGPQDGSLIICMHGEPSWSYLYRHMIRGLSARGYRVVAPDLVGFGRSDKPANTDDYTYERHVDWMSHWLMTNDFTNITLFGQDWGGLIGLRLVARFPERFARVVVSNTGLPIGTGWSEAFQDWLNFSQTVADLPIGAIIDGASIRELLPAEIEAYEAPFPDPTFKAGAKAFPMLVPITPAHASVDENTAAWAILETFTKPFLTAFSDKDQVSAGGERVFQDRVPGAKGQAHVIISGGGHFVQEDASPQLVDVIDQFIIANP